MLERIELPKALMSSVNQLADKRAWPFVLDGLNMNRPLRKIVRDIYCQGLADGAALKMRNET